MLERRRINILANRIYELGTEQMKLVRDGKYKKAEMKTREIDELSMKVQAMTKRELEKTARKADKASAKLDAKLRELGIYPESTDEEAKEYLQAIMRGR